MGFELTPRERRWLDVVLFLAAVTLAFVVLGYLGEPPAAFGDLILVFFLAWLLAFILSPVVARVASIPFLSRQGAVVIVYILLFGGLVDPRRGGGGRAGQLDHRLHRERPDPAEDLPGILAPWQGGSTGSGLGHRPRPARRRPSSTT